MYKNRMRTVLLPMGVVLEFYFIVQFILTLSLMLSTKNVTLINRVRFQVENVRFQRCLTCRCLSPKQFVYHVFCNLQRYD
jgi:hypothetical protein